MSSWLAESSFSFAPLYLLFSLNSCFRASPFFCLFIKLWQRSQRFLLVKLRAPVATFCNLRNRQFIFSVIGAVQKRKWAFLRKFSNRKAKRKKKRQRSVCFCNSQEDYQLAFVLLLQKTRWFLADLKKIMIFFFSWAGFNFNF